MAISKFRFLIITSVVLLILAALTAVFICTNANAADQETYAEHVPGEVIVKVETDPYVGETDNLIVAGREVSANLRQQVDNQINNFLSQYDCDTLLCITGNDEIYNDINADRSMITVKDVSDSNYKPAQTRHIKVKFNEDEKSMNQMISELKANSVVKEAEPNYVFENSSVEETNLETETAELTSETSTVQATSSASASTNSDSSNIYSNDVDFSSAQWAYDTEGSGTTHNNVGMNVANWNTSTPNVDAQDKVVVAVVDSGVDYNHPDLQCAGSDKAYGNLKDKIGYGGAQGYNAGVDDPASQLAEDPMDNRAEGHGHGTHVAGIIAATWNNNGVGGGANVCNILPVKAEDSQTGMFLADGIVRAFGYIVKAKQSNINVKAVNNSWAGPAPSSQVADLVNLLGQNGIISVFGTGNDKTNTDNYSYTVSSLQNNPYAITVDSTNKAGYLSSFSNYGVKTTDVCAPGDDIYSTVPSWTDYEGQSRNLMNSDTRYMNTADYSTIDNFESPSTEWKCKYYTDEACTTELKEPEDGKGYKGNNKALKINTGENIQYIYITGDSSLLQDNTRFSFLYNFDILTPKTDEGYCNLYDANNNDLLLAESQASPANNKDLTYGTVSAQVSKITIVNGKFKLKVLLAYKDESNKIVTNSAYIDNVSTAKKEYPYVNMSGTSMASPACCGMAAVVAAKFKDEPAEKVVARIKGGTNQKSWLSDKCYSGGIVDLGRACSAEADLDPVVLSASSQAATDTSSTIKLEGYFLGDSSSVVTINGKTATSVVSGSEGNRSFLTCTFSEKIEGAIAVTVNKAGKQLTRYLSVASSDNVLLERINLPDKSKDDSSDFYRSTINYLKYASDNYLMVYSLVAPTPTYYICNINNQSWERFDGSTLILEAIQQAGIDSTYAAYICGKDDTLIFIGIKNDGINYAMNALAYYDLNSKQITVEKFETPNIYVTFGFSDGDILYIAAQTGTHTTALESSMFKYNMTTKEFEKINTESSAGETIWNTVPKIYKVSECEFLLIDQGLNPTPSTIKNDMYSIKFSNSNDDSENSDAYCDSGYASATVAKLDQTAYPTTVTDASQDKYISHAWVDGKLMMIGAALFDSTSGGVSADTFLRDLDTQAESVASGLLSYSKAFVASSAQNSNYVYTYFMDGDGPAIAKRYIGAPGPGPTPDPTPGPSSDATPTSTAATGDPIGKLIWEIVWNI